MMSQNTSEAGCAHVKRGEQIRRRGRAPGRRNLCTMIGLSLVMGLALVSTAYAATDLQRCEKKKLAGLGKRELCMAKERSKEVAGRTPDFARCEARFQATILAAERIADCRWLENGDGTATDLNTGLQWELKTDDGSIHDVADMYTWSGTAPYTDRSGTAFVEFLGTLNGGISSDGTATTGCFADRCDWRLPTIEELAGILEEACGGIPPCTSIPGELIAHYYWSSSSVQDSETVAWLVLFNSARPGVGSKTNSSYVRAVRGGSVNP